MTQDSADNFPSQNNQSISAADLARREKIENSLRNQSWDMASLPVKHAYQNEGDDVVLSSKIRREGRCTPDL